MIRLSVPEILIPGFFVTEIFCDGRTEELGILVVGYMSKLISKCAFKLEMSLELISKINQNILDISKLISKRALAQKGYLNLIS